MKNLHSNWRDRFVLIRRAFVALMCLITGALTTHATVTVQGWWHLDNSQPTADSSGNARNFGDAYSTAPAAGGLVAALPINNGAGGPLDSTGWTSSECIRLGVGVGGKRQSTMWDINYNPPAQNYGIEVWVLPQDDGTAGGTGGWILSSGQTGGVAFRVNDNGDGSPYIDAFDVGNQLTIGDQVPMETNEWMELALVNNGGVITFYTNGVACGPSLINQGSASAGDVYFGAGPGDNQAYDGYADEARMFTFDAGAFTTNDLLLRPKGPNILDAPTSEVVWQGGAAPFSIVASFDFNTGALAQTYQWLQDGVPIANATNTTYTVSTVPASEDGSNFTAVVTLSGLAVTSTPPAVLNVVAPNVANVAAYQNDVKSTTGLVAYFPVDGSTSAVVTNVVNASYNGTLLDDAGYDGRTNRSFGQRGLLFDGNAAVSVPNDTAFEFSGGSGTIEALVYLTAVPGADVPIFSEGPDGGPSYYSLSIDSTGSFLIYTNDVTTSALSWSVPGGLVGQLLDVSLVIANTTSVTAYVNGQSLGAQTQTGFGSQPSGPFWIGSIGSTPAGSGFNGTIDELAIYGTALSTTTIQDHYTKLVFGTNVVPPQITSQPTGKTVFAGGSPELTITATGGLPLYYQWTSNGAAINGATSPTLVLSNSATDFSGVYQVVVSNVFGAYTSSPIDMTFTAPPAGYATTVMKDHPSAFWRMADSNGTVAVDSAGLNDATYSSTGVTYAAGGPSFDPTAAVAFDGNSGRAVTPANFPDLNPAGAFTIEFWARLTAYPTTHFYSPLSSMPRPSRTGGWEWYMDGNSPGYEFHTAEAGNYSLITADNNVPPDGDWWYLTGIWDGTNLYLYVNGQLGNYQIDPPAPAGTDNLTDEGQGQTEFVPNTSVPLYIGSRSDGADYFDGSMSDIAFYDYAFTYQQVTNHFSAAWIPASVIVPTGVTNNEGTTLTLSAQVTGLPNTYQWYFKGSALDASAVNADGTSHYPNGVTSTNLVVTEVEPNADSGAYYLQALNPAGNATSANINVVITPNTNPPTVVYVAGVATPDNLDTSGGTIPFVVKVVFSSRINATAGSTAANYSLSPSATITEATLLGSNPSTDVPAAQLAADWREAFLVTPGLTPGQKYTLTISGLKDQSQTPVSMPTTSVSFTAPTLTTGGANWDYYYLGDGISGAAPSEVEADQDYVDYAPETNMFLTSLDTTPITGGELDNNPFWGALGNYYGDVVSGWLTPPVTTNYTFFVAADDSAVFYLSTNASPANVALIAQLPSYVGSFAETNSDGGGLPPQDSGPILLKAGNSYFFEVIHEEITGGDFVKAAWRMQGDNTPAGALSPIPGTYLSTYAAGAAPSFTGITAAGGNFTLDWSGAGTLQESTNLVNWADVPGSPGSPFVLPVQSSTNILFFRLRY